MSYSIATAAREYLEINKEVEGLQRQVAEATERLNAKGVEIFNLDASEVFAIVEDGLVCQFVMDIDRGGCKK